MTDITLFKLSALITSFVLLSGQAWADATSGIPGRFKSDTYIEAAYEDFCKDQNSARKCISVTIKNESRATLDWKDNSKDGSLTGSGALDGFQVFEVPGCVSAKDLPSGIRKNVPSDGKFARRMRQESLHYWKPGRSKTIKVLQGCTYAVAVKREIGKHHWHYSYITPSALDGCTMRYKYVTSKADLKSYERWATFGAVGGAGGAGLTGIINGGFFTGAGYYSQVVGLQEEVVGQTMMETALQDGAILGGESILVILVAAAAYEAGLWGAYGVDELIRTLDGDRDFVLGKYCY